MHVSVMVFIGTHLHPEEVRGKRVLEVGSYDANGSVRPVIHNWGEPADYVGVDITEGPGVDKVVPAEDLVETFGEESVDVVLCLEVFEHLRHWRPALENMKRVLRPGGVLLLTTRSKGFKFHGWPDDYWRIELAEVEALFSDCEVVENLSDTQDPGVFIKVRKPADYTPADLDAVVLYCMMTDRRERIFDESFFDHSVYHRIQAKLRRRDLRKKLRAIRKKLTGWLFGG